MQMTFETRDNTGAIYKNDRKTNEKQPNLTGKCTISGKAHWISGWTKDGPDGNKYISLSFKPVEGGRTPPPSVDIVDDEICF